MALDHHEVSDRLGTDLEVEGCAQGFQLEKHWAEVVFDGAGLFGDGDTPIFLLLSDLEQCLPCRVLLIDVPYLKVYELDLESIGLGSAEVSLCWGLKIADLLDGDVGVHLLIRQSLCWSILSIKLL